MTLEAGTKLGPYEIVAAIGAGGMGEVYRARDTRLDREVAVKVLPTALAASPEGLKRFEQESRSIAALTHPNILNVFDVGRREDVSYVVLELLEGETLRERLQQAALPWRKAVEFAIGIADGLAAAHARGIIHRDIKPENLFITTDGVVKILDFGLARQESATPETPISRDSPTMTAATIPGARMGTIGYMSPEQLRGRAVDARSDIFSFGCVLYEMLTAGHAFVRDTVADTMTAILTEEPPDASSVSGAIPPELSRVLTRCLEKKADERFHSARDLAFALRSILTDSDSSGRAASVSSSRGGHRSLIVGISASALVLVASMFFLPRFFDPTGGASPDANARAVTRVAILPFTDKSPEPVKWFAFGQADAISTQLGRVRSSKLGVLGPDVTAHYAQSGKSLNELRRDLRVDFVLRGSIQNIDNDVRITANLISTEDLTSIWSEEFRGTMDDPFALQSVVAEKIITGLPFELTGEERGRWRTRYVPDSKAEVAYLHGLFGLQWEATNEQNLLRAVSYFEEAIDIDPNYALPYCGLVDAKCMLTTWGRLQTSQIRSELDAAVARALSLDPTLPEAHVSAAMVDTYLDWEWAGAEAAFERAIQLDPNLANAFSEYGHMLRVVGRYDEAQQRFEEAIRLNPVSSLHRSGLGMVHAALGQLGEAEQLFQEAYELNPDRSEPLVWLADVRQKQGRFDEGVEIMEEAVSPKENPELALRAFLGNAYAMAGRIDDAREQLTEMQTSGLPGHHMWFAELHAALGEVDEAFRRLDQAFEAREAWLPHIRLDPGLIHIRSDPRFAELHRKMGLEHVDLSYASTSP